MDTDSLTSGNYIYRINYEKIFSYTRPNENCHVKSDSVDGNRVSTVLMSSERVKTVKKETGVHFFRIHAGICLRYLALSGEKCRCLDDFRGELEQQLQRR